MIIGRESMIAVLPCLLFYTPLLAEQAVHSKGMHYVCSLGISFHIVSGKILWRSKSHLEKVYIFVSWMLFHDVTI